MGSVAQHTTWHQVNQTMLPKFYSLNQNYHSTNKYGCFLHKGARIPSQMFCQHLMPKIPLIDDLF